MNPAPSSDAPSAPAPAGPQSVVRSRFPSLKRNIAFALSGSVLFNGARFAVVVLLAKLAPPEVLGQFTYANSLSAPVVIFCGLSLRGAFVADAREEYTFGAYSRLRWLGMFIALTVMVGVVGWQSATDRGLDDSTHFWFVAMLLGVWLGKVAYSLTELYLGVYQRRERLSLQARSEGLRGITMLTSFVLAFAAAHLVYGVGLGQLTLSQSATAAAFAIAGYALAWALIWTLFDRRNALAGSDLDWNWDWPMVGRLFLRALPLGITLMIVNLIDSVPKWIIEDQPTGKEKLGYFGGISYIAMIGQLFIVQTGIAAANRLSTYYGTNHRAFMRLVGKLSALAAGLGGGFFLFVWLFGGWILRLLYTADYAAYHTEFVIVAAGQCTVMLGSMFGIVVTQMRKFWLQVPAQLFVLLVVTLVGLWLIPDDPVRGGAWAMLMRSVTTTVVYGSIVAAGVYASMRAARAGAAEDESDTKESPAD